MIGACIILIYTSLGGFWAVSVTDTLQGLLMAAVAVFLPPAALVAVGGFEGLRAGLRTVSSAQELSATGPYSGALALAFVLGTLGIGLGYPGQPHVVNRFMALRDRAALRSGRVIALTWAVLVYLGMLLLGICAKVIHPDLTANEQVLFEVANQLWSPVIAGVIIAAVLSAIMSTVDSQLLVVASAVTYDWHLASSERKNTLGLSRAVVTIVSLLAVLLALFAPEAIFSRVLFAWHAIGSAFGPLVLMRIAGYGVQPQATLLSLCLGFSLTVAFHLLPDTPGDFVERLVPFAIAYAVAIKGRHRPT